MNEPERGGEQNDGREKREKRNRIYDDKVLLTTALRALSGLQAPSHLLSSILSGHAGFSRWNLTFRNEACNPICRSPCTDLCVLLAIGIVESGSRQDLKGEEREKNLGHKELQEKSH